MTEQSLPVPVGPGSRPRLPPPPKLSEIPAPVLGVALVSKARPRSSVLHAELGAWSARALQRRAAEAEGLQAGRRVQFPK